MVSKIAANHSNGEEFDLNRYTERCLVQMILASSFNIITENVEDGDNKIEHLVEVVKL